MKNIFNKVKKELKPIQGFNMLGITGFNSYLAGIDEDENLVFMIKPDKTGIIKTSNSSKGKFLDIFYDIDCEITTNGNTIIDNYTILNLKTDNEVFEVIFITTCENIIKILGDEPKQFQVVDLIQSLRDIFRKLLSEPSQTELGLWGELLLIEVSDNKELLIDSWHKKSSQTFDFNDGNEKLEIKTTSKNERVHSFSLNQLEKAKDSQSHIISIMTSEIDRGFSVLDLFERINLGLNPDYQMRLMEKLIQVSGKDLENFYNKFDLKTGLESMRVFSALNVPSIKKEAIPKGISNIKFDINFEYVENLNTIEFHSTLISSIFNQK